MWWGKVGIGGEIMALQLIGPGSWANLLKRTKGKIATAEQLIRDRITREDNTHYKTGAWTSENFNVINKRILGARAPFNPLMQYAEQAIEAHRRGEFYLTENS